ncbi:taurine catabolism dioxygenase TauD [Amylocarpus encephaloides]|uniref:Taurine catabolism dioxygenase TauD n=1 Tax=Amylocarpus encephaloides TaxID=45428 RepID=A0A9P7Y7E7_9HELO|nr:taurine catabolism dioxygenase TauD [Amylocarpus encephaloides]
MKHEYRRHVRPQCTRLSRCLGRLFDMQYAIHPALTFSRFSRPASSQSRHEMAPVAAMTPLTIPQLTAPDLAHAKQRHHVYSASQNLQLHGILKISLGFPDPGSQYLEQLVLSLHEDHGHQLPISHSASCGWFWDVRPSINTPFQTPQLQARSETMEEFPWHTDCSYEDLPPRDFALHVLQHDRFGGGTLSVMNVQRLSELLSPGTRASLMRQDYGIRIPLEFIKEPAKRGVVGSVLTAQQDVQPCMMRFRRDLVTPLTERASRALQELDMSLQDAETQAQSTLHLTSKDLSAGTVILLDNRRWLHARNNVKDPKRHLRRLRWDAVPLNNAPVE